MKLSANQKRAGFYEFAVGVPLNILFFCALYFGILPDYPNLDTALGRVVFALICCALPGAVVMIALSSVALGRGTSKAIDPLAGMESRTLTILIRFLQSSLEQAVIFILSGVSLSAFLGPTTIKMIPAFAILFFVNRFVFLFGYLKDPMLRGAGLSGTLYPLIFMTLAALFYATKFILTGR